jgi:phage terminase large subunit GpA-like protein
MDAAHDEGVTEVVVMKSAQVGWTESLNNTIGYHIDQDPAPILLLQPTLEMAEAWSKDRLAPMIRDTARLNGKVADPKARDSGNTLLHKLFTGGHLTIVGANSPAGLASRPIRVLLCDEVDRFPASAGTEGDPIDLAKRRTARFRNRKILMGSTPTVKGSSRIEAAFEQSDSRYFFLPCPHCQQFQRLVWAQVKWDAGKPETAAYVCAHCATLLTDADKAEMLKRGEWRGTKPFNGIAGFHISELYSPWSTWAEMAIAFSRASLLPETLKTFINTVLGETWEEHGGVEVVGLIERKESYGAENIPDGTLMLTAGCDTQDDRVEVQLNGWGADEENWIIEQKVFRGDPGKPQLWQEVDAYLLQTFHTESGRRLTVDAVAVDSGGHNTQSVYQFVVTRKRRRVWAIKGLGGPGKLAWPKKATKTRKSRASLFLIGVDTIKAVLYGRLSKVSEPGPGYVHLPADADAEFCKQLTSEKSYTKYLRGRPSIVWEPREKGARQEAQDCWVYAYAAFIGRRGPEVLKRFALRRPKLEPKAELVELADIPTPVPAPVILNKPASRARRSAGWVRNWRQ